MHRDLQIRDLKDDDRHPAFVIVGQLEIQIHEESNDEISVELLGYDTYDPATGTVKAGSANDVACWMLDTELPPVCLTRGLCGLFESVRCSVVFLPFCRGRVGEAGVESLGVVAAEPGEDLASGLVAGGEAAPVDEFSFEA